MITFNCRRCRQEMAVPDSRAGQLESCPTCNNINEVPRPHAAERVKPARFAAADIGTDSRKPDFGPERILEFVGVLIGAIGMVGLVGGVAMLFLREPVESPVPAYSVITAGISSFVAGLALAALGSVVVELKKIRVLLDRPNRPCP